SKFALGLPRLFDRVPFRSGLTRSHPPVVTPAAAIAITERTSSLRRSWRRAARSFLSSLVRRRTARCSRPRQARRAELQGYRDAVQSGSEKARIRRLHLRALCSLRSRPTLNPHSPRTPCPRLVAHPSLFIAS